MTQIQEFIEQCTSKVPNDLGRDGLSCIETFFDKEKFYLLIVQHASECIRDVLRDEYSGLSYQVADKVQNRFKEFFEVSW